MKRKLYLSLLLAAFMLAGSASVHAQCPAGRYQYAFDPLFTGYTMVTDTYSTANSYTALVDIYQPTGDTLTARPLIILAHGGSFISGTRNDDVTVDSLCVRFAQRGYVTASIEYRLGNAISMFLDSTNAINEVMMAISDGKAAIRYFVKDAATLNKYKIDTNHIFVGGNSAGAVLYMHVGYIDSIGELPAYLQTAMNANGGFEGNSGNAGYTTKFKAVINLAGALNEVGFVGPGDVPSVNAQGDQDSTVPYHCADPFLGAGYIHVNLCGLGSLEARYDSMGINHMSHVFPGQGHVPWSSDAGMFVTVDSLVQQFLYNEVCIAPSAVIDVQAAPQVDLYPNPAHDVINISSSRQLANITITDQVGRVVSEVKCQGTSAQVNTSKLAKGMYLLRMSFENGDFASVVRKVVIN